MVGEIIFRPELFLMVLDTKIPSSTSYVYQMVGCSRETAKKNIRLLEASGKIKQFEARGVRELLWVKVE